MKDAPFQLSDVEWESLISKYLIWVEQQRRDCAPGFTGNNNMDTHRVESALKLIYHGLRRREIQRRQEINSMTLAGIMQKLMTFLGAHKFTSPKCACGNKIWHSGLCLVWDTYHAGAIAKGHASQARMARERQAAIFFQTINNVNTMTNALIQPVQSNAERFAELVQQGINAWTEAGKLLVRMIEENPDAKEEIMERCPDVTEEILSRFEAIGRNQLHPKTLLNNSPGMRRLRQLPFSDQSRFLSEPVPVLVKTESGADILHVAVKDLTSTQASQVFSADGIRSAPAQRAWLESRKSKKQKPVAVYQIRGHKVTFNAGCEMTARELAHILSQIS